MGSRGKSSTQAYKHSIKTSGPAYKHTIETSGPAYKRTRAWQTTLTHFLFLLICLNAGFYCMLICWSAGFYTLLICWSAGFSSLSTSFGIYAYMPVCCFLLLIPFALICLNAVFSIYAYALIDADFFLPRLPPLIPNTMNSFILEPRSYLALGYR